jgi:spore coat polysaccharide biosynthesis predicted glycosyltransferase SpsG
MSVAFRADTALAIGTGQVMRCLTLADALQKRYLTLSRL